MKRREVLALIGAAACPLAWPLPSAAQTTAKRPRIGVLIFSTPQSDPNTQSFLRGMRDLGYIDGQTIDIEYRFAEGKLERMSGLATELVALKPDMIFALGGDVTPIAAKVVQTIPLVYAMSADPVQLGIASSLAKPGRNATGVTFLSDELAAKRLEILKEVAPRIARVGFLHDVNHIDNELPVAQRAASAHGIVLHPLAMRGPGELDAALNAALQARVDSIYVVSSRHTAAAIPRIVDFVTKNRLPLAGGWGAWAQSGGLVSYGPNVDDMIRQTAPYVDRILKGARPDALPIQQPTRFELLINLKTAKALGLTVPESFLLRADRVIE